MYKKNILFLILFFLVDFLISSNIEEDLVKAAANGDTKKCEIILNKPGTNVTGINKK